MADDQRSPDHTDDPRRQDTGQGGYPESNPEGTRDDDAADGPQSTGSDTEAPSPSTDKEADRGASTGNPGAAG